MEGEAISRLLRKLQRNEITEYHIYGHLAKIDRTGNNRELLEEIARDEHRHYTVIEKITGVEIKPDRIRIFYYVLLLFFLFVLK